MLKPIQVTLADYDPAWPVQAADLSNILQEILGPVLIAVHHVGSTSVPGLKAKPILDLLPEVSNLESLDQRKSRLEEHGFSWHGEFGLPGRRYCKLDDPDTGQRIAQLHCYQAGSREITRHLAFRDYLRNHPDVARAYERIKISCRNQFPVDSHQYGDCKSDWIREVELSTLRWALASAQSD